MKNVYNTFGGTADAPWYDTDGKRIQAHGGQVQKFTVNGKDKWYWIGEDKTYGYRPCGGIHLYSSDDLYNWKDEGIILRTMESTDEFEEPYFKELYGSLTKEEKETIFIDLDRNRCVIERPKMLYNEKTGKYVIWFHADGRFPGCKGDYDKAKAGVAVCDRPNGAFRMLGSYKLNYHNDPNGEYGFDGWENRGSVRDMNLFLDKDRTAYIIYSSEGNRTTFVSRLNEEYTNLAVDRDQAVEGVDFTRNFIGCFREAHAMFCYQNKYYMINSGCTSWSPNPARYAVADHPMGPWRDMGDPCMEKGRETTYDSQSTCVILVDEEKGGCIYMGDRWKEEDLAVSGYIWLPIVFLPDGKMILEKREDWSYGQESSK
ncbi:MAG: hypothetical protein HFI82_12740 [Eubacterium sp.]|jgi:hypothetical protein|nr:hypothetical protein [Eubacterium sp.]